MHFLLSFGLALALVSQPSSAWVSSSLSSRTNPTSLKSSAETAFPSSSASSSKLSRAGFDESAWRKAWATCPEEISPTVLDCPNLPEDFPVGTYYRNGHASFASPDGQPVYHMFDGDGMVSAITFDATKKKLLFRNRFVRTAGYVNDQEQGEMTQPGVFGTKASGGLFKNLFRTDFKNVANTNVIYANNNLYALWEGGLPHVLDPLTLENDFEKEPNGHSLNGLLQGEDRFSAHPRYDPDSNTIVNFGITLDPASGQSKIALFELDQATMQPVRSDPMEFWFPGAGVVHDFCVTENWCLFAMPPATLDGTTALKALFGQASFVDSIDFQDSTESTVYLIPRSKHLKEGTAGNMVAGEDDRVKVIKTPYHFNFHFANAFEDENGNVVFDSVMSEKVQLGSDADRDVSLWETADLDQFFPSSYVRMIVDPVHESMTIGEPNPQTISSSRDPEFPSIPRQLSTKKHRYAYTVGSHCTLEPFEDGRGKGVAGAILKIDTESPEDSEDYAFEPYETVGEQIFCPKKGVDVSQLGCEDKGYLVAYVHNGKDLTTDLVVFDVEGKGALQKGPAVRMQLPTYIPPALHGTFVEGLNFEME